MKNIRLKKLKILEGLKEKDYNFDTYFKKGYYCSIYPDCKSNLSRPCFFENNKLFPKKNYFCDKSNKEVIKNLIKWKGEKAK